MENRKNRILVVDNELALLFAFKKLLSTSEIQVDTAETFEESIAMIEKNKYQVIVADLRLSGVSGEEGLIILKYIKKEESETHFILITGYGSPEIKKRALAEGTDCYLEKPVSISTLKEALGQLGITY